MLCIGSCPFFWLIDAVVHVAALLGLGHAQGWLVFASNIVEEIGRKRQLGAQSCSLTYGANLPMSVLEIETVLQKEA